MENPVPQELVDEGRSPPLRLDNNLLPAIAAGACPKCRRSSLIEKRCYSCKFCGVCGIHWEGASCPNCFPVVIGDQITHPAFAAGVVGGAPFSDSDTNKMVGRPLPPRLRKYYGRGITSDKDETSIHSCAEKFVGCLGLGNSAANAHAERIESSALRIHNSTKMRIRDAVAVSLCIEERRLGLVELTRRISNVAPDLAKLGSLKVRCDVSLPNQKVTVYANGRERIKVLPRQDDLSTTIVVVVPLYVFDAGALLHFEGIRCFVRGLYDQNYTWRSIAEVADERTLRLKDTLNALKCFKLYKLLKKAAVDLGIFSSSTSSDSSTRSLPLMANRYPSSSISDGLNNEAVKIAWQRFPISKLPGTEFMLKQTGCLPQVQARFLKIFSVRFGSSRDNGVSDKTIARASLIQAGEDVYDLLPIERKILASDLSRRFRAPRLILESEINKFW